MNLYCRVIQPDDLAEIADFEQRKLAETVPDQDERTIQSWNARWRKESLDHYVPMGWSFLARDRDQTSAFSEEGTLIGYFIAQPLLFLDGKTQSLWVEHVSTSALKARDELCDLAYRLCREKNFQRVYFPNVGTVGNSVAAFKPETGLASVLCVRTSKG